MWKSISKVLQKLQDGFIFKISVTVTLSSGMTLG